MQSAGGIKNRKRRQQKLQDVLTKKEEDIKITTIQSLDLEEFYALIETIDKQTAPKIKKRLEDSLESHFKQIANLSSDNKQTHFTEILSFRALVQNYKKILNNESLMDDLKEPLISVVKDYDKKVNKIVDQVIAMRDSLKQQQELDNQNFISLAILNIKEKILKYHTPTDNTAYNNLKRTLDSLVIGIKARLEDTERSDVIQFEKDNQIFIKLPSPAKFFETDNIQVDRTIAEHQISSIKDLYLLLSALKSTIRNMPNIKRNHINNIRKETDKYPPNTFDKMIQQLDDIVNNTALEMAQILVKNIPKLLKQNNELVNIYSEPYLKQNKSNLYIYDALEEITYEILRSYNPMYENGYKLLINSLYMKWMDEIFPLLTDKRAERLLLVRAVNRLFELEDKMGLSFVVIKQKLAQQPITAKLVQDQADKIKIIDKLLAQKKPTKKTVEVVNMTLDDILKGMEVKPTVQIKEEPPKVPKEKYDELIKSLKDTNNYATLQNQIIKHYYQKHGTKLDYSFYKNITRDEYQTRYLCHLSGFFQMYANVYGHYGRSFFRDMAESNNSFHLWRATRVDSGELINEYRKFLQAVINHKFVLFRNEKLEMRSLNKEEKTIVNSFFQNVNKAYDNVLKLNEKVEVVAEKSTGVCKHITVEEELNRVYDILEKDPENKDLQNELNQLLQEKEQCTIESDSAIICKHCHVQLEVIISAEPSSFDDAQDLIADQQKEIMFDIQQYNQDLEEEHNKKIASRYIDLYIKVLNIQIVEEVSLFSDAIAIAKSDIENITEQIHKIITMNDSIIYKNASSFFSKKSKVSSTSMKNQLNHDLTKFLTIFFLLNRVGDNLDKDNLPCKNVINNEVAYIQCLFQHVQSFESYVDKTMLTANVRLNYIIRVYNLAIDILRTSQNFTFEKDTSVITEESLDTLSEEKLIVISQDFGLKQKNIVNLKKVIARSNNNAIDLPLNIKEITSKILNNLNESYQNILENVDKVVFKRKEITDLFNVLEQFILLSEKKENIRIQLKQNNLNVKEIKGSISDLEKKINVSAVPSEKLFLEQQLNSLQNILTKYEEDKKELANKTKQLQQDQEDIQQIEKVIDTYVLPHEGLNIVNLYQYFLYMSRDENKNNLNPEIINYNKAHNDLNLYERLNKKFPNLDYRLIQKYIYQLFMNRYELLSNARKDIAFLDQMKSLAPVLHDKGELSTIVSASEKKHFIYESELGVVKLDYSFIEYFRKYLKISTSITSFSILNALINSHVFQDIAKNRINFDVKDAKTIINQEFESYSNIRAYFNELNDVIYLCPVCDRSDTHNINVKHHLTSHHISTNDNLRSIRPMRYISSMAWISGQSNFKDGYICPYCPYRHSVSKIYEHIRNEHMNLKHSREMFQEAEKRRYYAHLENLYKKHKSEYDPSLEDGTIHFEENKDILEAAKNIDNLDDKAKYYVVFCDKNIDTFTTMRHVYMNNQCIYCKRSVARIHQDAQQPTEKHVENLVKLIEKRLKELNARYCLLNATHELHKNPCQQKRKMVSNMLNGKQTVLLKKLLTPDVSWELNRQLDHIPFRVAKHLTDVVEVYKHNIRDYYRGDIPLYMASLDEIDEAYAYKDNQIKGYYRKYDNNYLKYVSSPYRVLSKEARDSIFYHKDVLARETEIKEHQKSIGKMVPEEYNKHMNQLVENLRKEIAKRAEIYLNTLADSTTISGLAQDLTTVLGRTDGDAYVDIIKKLNDQHISVNMTDDYINNILNIMPMNSMMNDAFIEESARRLKKTSDKMSLTDKEKRDQIRQFADWSYIESLVSLPQKMLMQLLLLSDDIRTSYRQKHYVILQKRK